MTSTGPHSWNAADYDVTNAGIIELGMAVLDRLTLTGDETVLDAGCGTGVVTELLLDRLPRGEVIALDADPAMVGFARERFSDRSNVETIEADLRDFDLGGRHVDIIFSTATFHWIGDHILLWQTLRSVLKDGGRLVAQCGGAGNIAAQRDAYLAVSGIAPYAEHLEGFDPANFATPDETTERMLAAGFASADCWLQDTPITPVDKGKHLREIILGSHLEKLPEGLRDSFAREVESRLPDSPSVGYVRLNIDAVA